MVVELLFLFWAMQFCQGRSHILECYGTGLALGAIAFTPSAALFVLMSIAGFFGSDKFAEFLARLNVGVAISTMLMFLPGYLNLLRGEQVEGSGMGIVAWSCAIILGGLSAAVIILRYIIRTVRARFT